MEQSSFIALPATPPAEETPASRVLHEAAALPASDLLSLLLNGARPEELARRVVGQFSLYGLPKASTADLLAIKGLGLANVKRIRAAVELARQLWEARPEERQTIRSPADAGQLLLYDLSHREQEYLYVILLDTRNRVIGKPIEVYHGSLNTSLIRVAELFRDAIKANAAAIILLHNHPSGDPSPSPEDVAVTRAVVECGQQLDIAVLDHLVIAGGRFISLKERGLGFGGA